MTETASMRMFVAVEVPPGVRAQVQSAVQSAIATLPADVSGTGLRWVRPDAWHLTLTFLGAVEPRRLDDLSSRLGRAAIRSGPLTLQVSGAGRFRGNVLWVGVTGDLVQLRRLAASTSAAARRAAIDVDEKPYRAHLTLARNSGAGDLRSFVAALNGLSSDPWTARELSLIRSHLGAGPDGTARHDVMVSWPLGRTPAGGDEQSPAMQRTRPEP